MYHIFLTYTRLIAGLRPAFCSPNGFLMSWEWGNFEGEVGVEKIVSGKLEWMEKLGGGN